MFTYSLKVRAKPERSSKTPVRATRRKKKSQFDDLTNEQRYIVDALQIVYEIRKALEEYMETFHAIRTVVHKALDLKFSDNDRRLLNRQYQGHLRALDEFVKDVRIQGVLIFDGHDKKPTISLPLTEDRSEVVNIIINGFDLDTLRLRETRVDSIVHARKVEKFIKETEEKLQDFHQYLDNKDAALDVRRASLGIPMPDFEKSSNEEDAYEEVYEEHANGYEIQTPQLRELKDRQLKAARAKGRESALLVNIRG